jgi:Ca-activated chloride channel family protein
LYDTADGKLGASVLSYRPDSNDDGYFLLLASPEVKATNDERPKKTVLFVVDRSGSMSGKKFDQAKEALKFVLNNLREGDTFNIVAYDSVVESFRPELHKFDETTRKQALGYVDGLYPGGSTNIDGALGTALGMIQDPSRPNFVLFLTDGIPTAGETNEAKIVTSVRGKNTYKTRVISFGVGYDLNSRLLDRLSRENFGQTEFVRPDENIEANVSRLYSKMSSPAMTNVVVKVDVDGGSAETAAVNRVYPKEVYDLFIGEQLVQVGRYKKHGGAKITITGKVGSEEKKYDFPATLVEKSNDQSYAFVEKLWALRRIGEILDELDLKGKNEELVKELVGLSTKHGILTPYTSYLADDQARPGQLADMSSNIRRSSDALKELEKAEGKSGVAQRAEKNAFRFAEQAAAPAAPGFGGAGHNAEGRGLAAGSGYRDIANDRIVATDAVQVAGNQSYYRRGRMWIADNAKDVDPEKADANVKKIARFSDDYFALVKENSVEENAIFARQQTGETVLVKLRGQVYRIE